MHILRHLASFSAHLFLALCRHVSIFRPALKSPADRFPPVPPRMPDYPLSATLSEKSLVWTGCILCWLLLSAQRQPGPMCFSKDQGYPLRQWLDISCLYLPYHPVITGSLWILQKEPQTRRGEAWKGPHVQLGSTQQHKRPRKSLVCFTFRNVLEAWKSHVIIISNFNHNHDNNS